MDFHNIQASWPFEVVFIKGTVKKSQTIVALYGYSSYIIWKYLKVETVSTFSQLKVETVSTFTHLRVETLDINVLP